MITPLLSRSLLRHQRLLHNQAGFSLLELLVVISIIGILIAVSVAGFSTAQSRSRDARRRSDVKAIQNAMEQFFAENTTYTGGCAALGTYIQGGLPLDPQSGDPLNCDDTAGTSYCASATLEDDTGGNCNGCSPVGSTGGTDYCLLNLQ